MSKKNILIFTFVVLPIIVAIGGSVIIMKQFYAPYEGNEVAFTVRSGEGFSSVNGRLISAKIISSPRIFHRYTKFKNKMSSLKVGTYTIPQGATMSEVLTILTEGVPILTRVTIPEGKNMYEVAKIFEAKGLVDAKEFIQLSKSQKMKAVLGVDGPSLEGYLFPETYMFSPETSVKEIIVTMLKQFRKQTKDIDLNHSFLSPHEVVILASIVEKETGAKWERPIIAGVYLNRLVKKMRLQADPTTIYGIWETYNGNLRRRHLLEKTPYNTYKINGLPLGPIANPSLAAIKAVMNPEKHKYIYFVSKNDGTHKFTSTYKEHLKAVDYWQRNRKNRVGKSWRDLKQKKK